MKILISPYSAKLRSGKPNPKMYPNWEKLVFLLKETHYEVVQIGLAHETRIEGVDQFITNFPFRKLRDLAQECGTWISVDNFWPHFVHAERLKRGIVLWGPSDPKLFGYSYNVNLLRGRDFLRHYQYDTWEAAEWDPNAFVYAENVIPHVVKVAPPPLVRVASI